VCLLVFALSCHQRGLPTGLMHGNLAVTGVDVAGRRASWSPRPGKLSLLVVLRANDCAACVTWFTDGVKRLLASRPNDLHACFLFVGRGDGAYALGPAGSGPQALYDRKGTVIKELPLPGLPYVFVWTRENLLARGEWIPPLGEDPAGVARRLERCFVLEGTHGQSN